MLILHRSNRVETLVDALCEVLAEPVGPPTVEEWIAVQSRGMESWLSMELSRRFGVWGAARFPFPRAMVEDLFEIAGLPQPYGGFTFTSGNLTWALLAELPGLLDRPGFEPLKAYLDGDRRGTKRLALARRIAAALDQYPLYRPDMVREWEQGNGEGWQADLLRAIVVRHGSAHVEARARAFAEALPALDPDDFPRRISCFGISSLPPLYLQVLANIPTPVHLFMLCPSEHTWTQIRAQRGQIREHLARDRSAAKAELPVQEHNPLLASLGGLGRDFQQVLEGIADYEDVSQFTGPGDPTTLLATLQADVFADRRRDRGGEAPAPLDPDDHSLAVHACHSAMREVEVLHDQLLHLLEHDDSLQPHDVIVMAPDVEAYAPLVEAVFVASGDIPFRISDRRARGMAPAAEAFTAALRLVRSRVTATDVLDLLAIESVRERFGLGPDEVETIQHWVDEVGIRWGIDADHRDAFDQPITAQNTWQFGLDRLLLGYALPGEQLFGGVLPYDEIEGQGADVLGRFSAFCEALLPRLRSLEEPRTLEAWADDLGRLLDRITDGEGGRAWQQQVIRTALDGLVARAALAGFDQEVELEVVRACLEDHLDESRSAHGFLSGGVTICNLLPMRSIPFRVVVLLGMNDGEFPRTRRAPGFDLVAHHPRLGDRSVRSDDRYLFLEALLAARQHLLITYVGNSIHDNAVLPPSVLVAELLDVARESCALPGGDPLVTRHPLQPFSPRYFTGDPRLVSYRAGYCDGARALLDPRRDAPPFLEGALTPDPDEPRVVSIEQLTRFFAGPAAWLLEQRIGVRFVEPDDLLDDREPVELGGLDRWAAESDMLAHAVAGGDLEDFEPVLRGRGQLPLGTPGRCAFEELLDRVSPFVAVVRDAIRGDPLDPLAVDMDIDGTRLTGRLDRLWPDARIRFSVSTVKPRNRLELWLEHLALSCAAAEGLPSRSLLLARGAGGHPTRLALDSPGEGGRALLADLIELYWHGQQAPLRFFPATSLEYAQQLLTTGDPEVALKKARAAWLPSWSGYPKSDSEDEAVRRFFGQVDPLTDSPEDADLSFAFLALRVYQPLLERSTEEPA